VKSADNSDYIDAASLYINAVTNDVMQSVDTQIALVNLKIAMLMNDGTYRYSTTFTAETNCNGVTVTGTFITPQQWTVPLVDPGSLDTTVYDLSTMMTLNSHLIACPVKYTLYG
jgi:hypothetical protein